MAQIKVVIKGKPPEVIEARQGWTPEGWLQAMRRSNGGYVVLNTTSYLKEEITDAEEVKEGRGFTNMDGI